MFGLGQANPVKVTEEASTDFVGQEALARKNLATAKLRLTVAECALGKFNVARFTGRIFLASEVLSQQPALESELAAAQREFRELLKIWCEFKSLHGGDKTNAA